MHSSADVRARHCERNVIFSTRGAENSRHCDAIHSHSSTHLKPKDSCSCGAYRYRREPGAEVLMRISADTFAHRRRKISVERGSPIQAPANLPQRHPKRILSPKKRKSHKVYRVQQLEAFRSIAPNHPEIYFREFRFRSSLSNAAVTLQCPARTCVTILLKRNSHR